MGDYPLAMSQGLRIGWECCHTRAMTSSWIVFLGTCLAVLLIVIGVVIWVWAVKKSTAPAGRPLAPVESKPWEKIWEEVSAALKTIRSGLSDAHRRVFALGTLLVMIGLFIMIAWSMPILVADKVGGDDSTPAASATPTPASTPS
jgi:nucleoside recognition membrane protein YjiH